MSPEYAMFGQFSVKSDVFSFGVIILEIVSGKRNVDFNGVNSTDDLLSHVSIIIFTFQIFHIVKKEKKKTSK